MKYQAIINGSDLLDVHDTLDAVYEDLKNSGYNIDNFTTSIFGYLEDLEQNITIAHFIPVDEAIYVEENDAIPEPIFLNESRPIAPEGPFIDPIVTDPVLPEEPPVDPETPTEPEVG
jgi:hypothetical protein